MRELTAIYEEMRDAFAERAGFAPGESCDSAVRLYALAAQVQALLMQTDWVLDQSFPQTAQGKYLNYHAQTRGIGRMPALHAEGTLRFAAADKVTSELSVDKGAVCMTADGVRFETTEDAVIKKGSVWADVPARAVEAGERGNVIAGMVTVMSARPVGIVQCTNPTAFTGGCDDEDDESLRARILESYRRLPNGANAAYYEKEAMSFPGVAAAKAVGRARHRNGGRNRRGAGGRSLRAAAGHGGGALAEKAGDRGRSACACAHGKAGRGEGRAQRGGRL